MDVPVENQQGGRQTYRIPAELSDRYSHPAQRRPTDDIADAAALGVPDEKLGERLSVYVVRRAGAELSEDSVRDYVRANLARFKVPRDVIFLQELPRNPTGKVLKRALRDLS